MSFEIQERKNKKFEKKIKISLNVSAIVDCKKKFSLSSPKTTTSILDFSVYRLRSIIGTTYSSTLHLYFHPDWKKLGGNAAFVHVYRHALDVLDDECPWICLQPLHRQEL